MAKEEVAKEEVAKEEGAKEEGTKEEGAKEEAGKLVLLYQVHQFYGFLLIGSHNSIQYLQKAQQREARQQRQG